MAKGASVLIKGSEQFSGYKSPVGAAAFVSEKLL
jgi:hypothetical protein